MDEGKLRRIIAQALQKLSPLSLKLDIGSEDSLKVSVISGSFAGMNTKGRFDAVWSLLEQYAPKTLDSFLWSFELWTDAEVERLGIDDSNFSKISRALNDGEAAKQVDI